MHSYIQSELACSPDAHGTMFEAFVNNKKPLAPKPQRSALNPKP